MLTKMVPPSTHSNNLIDLCVKKNFFAKKKKPSIYLIIKVQIYARATTKMECRDGTVRVEGLSKWREAITTENILCLPIIVLMPFQKELSYSKIDKTNALKRIAFPLMNLRIDHFCLHGHKIKLSECFMILFIIHFLSDFP